MNYEQFFIAVKHRLVDDLGSSFPISHLDDLSLSLNYHRRTLMSNNDQYRSKKSKIPAYYNPNTHTVHLNITVLDNANNELVENIYYHELLHASSHHAKMEYDGMKILKSGLKIQLWDEEDRPVTLHRGLNEGLTQYFANSYSPYSPAYKEEVRIVGLLVRKLGLQTLKSAYFGAAIDELEQQMAAKFGVDMFNKVSTLVDEKRYEEAEALLA